MVTNRAAKIILQVQQHICSMEQKLFLDRVVFLILFEGARGEDDRKLCSYCTLSSYILLFSRFCKVLSGNFRSIGFERSMLFSRKG